MSLHDQINNIQVKPIQVQPVQVQPVQVQPVQVQPVQVKPVQVQPVQVKPVVTQGLGQRMPVKPMTAAVKNEAARAAAAALVASFKRK